MMPIVDRKRDSRRRGSSALLLKTEKMTEEEVIVKLLKLEVAEAMFLKSLTPPPRYRQYLAHALSHMALGDLGERSYLRLLKQPFYEASSPAPPYTGLEAQTYGDGISYRNQLVFCPKNW
ncbi:unnamed protein product [Porites evermanni]|uniref:Uncharacterized protein n=1 Tax=Porites evermanni TaxID=104178 RepID=A0ABN8QFW3_9CNID|nr:unnamed protein product [Porites evermanni]